MIMETVRNEVLEQRVVGVWTYKTLTCAAFAVPSHTGRLGLLKEPPQLVTVSQKQPKVMRTPCIMQFAPPCNSTYLHIIL